MERKSLFARRGGNVTRPETFAIVVEDYDTSGNLAERHKVRGKRLDTGEVVDVTLRKVDYQKKGRNVRSEIADFAAPRKDRQHPGTSIGGTLLVQEAFKQNDGTFAARWIQSLSHTPGEAEVFMATIHVTPVRNGAKTETYPDGRPYSLMTVMHDGNFENISGDMAEILKYTPPFQVNNIDELREALTDLMSDGLGVGVRVKTDDGFDAMYVGRKRDVSPAELVDAFMKDVEPISEAINSGEALCEVIPYANMWAGPTTVDIMVKNEVVKSRIRQFNHESTDGRGRTHPVQVFRPAVVAARMTKPGDNGSRSVFFTHFEPLWTRQPVHGLVTALCYAQTENFAPEPPRLNAPAANAQEPAANGGEPGDGMDSGYGSFEGGPSDDDLMGAAASAGAPSGDIGDDILPAHEEAAPAPAESRPARQYRRRA